MALAHLRYCAEPGCTAKVRGGRCPRHTREYNHRRGSAKARGYDYAWSQYSKAWLARHPTCGERADGQLFAQHSRCIREGRLTPADCTDHIMPLSRGGAKWDPLNHQSLCFSCNVAKGDRLP